MRIIFLLLLGFLFCPPANAQTRDSLKRVYQNQTIYRYGGHFIKGNDRMNFDDLEIEFLYSDLGLDGYRRAKKFRTVSRVFRYISMLSTIVIAPLIGNNNKNGAYIFLGINFALGYGST